MLKTIGSFHAFQSYIVYLPNFAGNHSVTHLTVIIMMSHIFLMFDITEGYTSNSGYHDKPYLMLDIIDGSI